MGFVPQRTEYTLDFAGTGLDGLEVTTRAPSMDTLLAILAFAGTAGDGTGPPASVSTAQADALFGLFAQVLVSWNLETDTADGRKAVPATKEGLLSQDPGFIMSVISAWSAQTTTHRRPPAAPAAAAADAAAAREAALQLADLPGSSGAGDA